MNFDPLLWNTVDVRSVPSRLRHPMVFETFDSLLPGEALILVNDRDPKPFYYQLQADSGTAFTWEYLEDGPEVWRVRIRRAGYPQTSTEDSCCCH